MDIRDLKAFYFIVETGNISNASKKLNIAQPALSRQIKQLEASLGTQLFERGSRKIKLTEAGILLRQRAEQILSLVDGTIAELTEIHSGIGGNISIGTVTTSGALLLPELIQEFCTLYPHVTFKLWEGNGLHVLDLLDKGVIELGIIRSPFDIDNYDSIIFPKEPLVIAMKKSLCTPNNNAKTIRLIELANQPLIIPLRWKDMFEEWCAKAGFSPHIVCLSDGIVLNVLWAKSGIGVALVPKSTEGLISDSTLIYKEIIEPEVSTQTAILWTKNRRLSASSKLFLELINKMNAQ